MLKKVGILIIVINIIFLLSSCYDAHEIDDEVYAISIGIDKGKHNKVRVTIQYPTYKDGNGGGGMSGGDQNENKQEGSNVHTIEAPSILEAIDMMGMAISRRVSLMHAKNFIISEELAKEGIFPFIQAVKRYYETRPTMNIIIARGTAEEFILESKTNIGGTINKALELHIKQSANSGSFPSIALHEFNRNVTSNSIQPVAIYGGVNDFSLLKNDEEESGETSQEVINENESTGEEEKSDQQDDDSQQDSKLNVKKGFLPGELPRKAVAKRELVGTAVFRDDVFVGYLDTIETSFYLMAINKYKAGSITIEDQRKKGYAIVIEPRSNGSKVRVSLNGDKPVINLSLNIEADLESVQSGIEYESIDMIENLNTDFEKYLTKGIKDTITKTQKEFKSDIFGFGKYAKSNFLTIDEWIKYDWLNKYEYAEVNVEVSVNIRRTGILIKTANENS